MKRRGSLLCSLLLAGALLTGCGQKGSHGSFYNYDLTNYVTLGDYKTVHYSPAVTTVEEQEITEKIRQTMQEQGLVRQQESGGPICSGDTAVIDFTGYIDGKKFEDGTAQGYSLKIGSGEFIAGFETGLIGKKQGEKVTLNLQFPASYRPKTYAGKAVRFEVTIQKILTSVYPELTDEVAADLSGGESAEAYRQTVRQQLQREKEALADDLNRTHLIQAVVECCTIQKYPKKEMSLYRQQSLQAYTDYAANQSMTLESMLSYSGMTRKQLDEQIQQASEEQVAQEMVFLAIADREEIVLSEEEYREGLGRYQEKYGYASQTTMIEHYGEDRIRGLILIDKVIDYVGSSVAKG